MRAVLALPLLLLSFAPPAAGGSDAVAFELTLGNAAHAPYKACEVPLAEGATVADLLDAATAQGCISGWTYAESPFGRYVTSIDGIPEAAVTYWALYEGGAYAQCGIDCTYPEPGIALSFNYETWATFLLP